LLSRIIIGKIEQNVPKKPRIEKRKAPADVRKRSEGIRLGRRKIFP